MRRLSLRHTWVCRTVSVAAMLEVLAACAPREGPADRIERLRGHYVAEIAGFVVEPAASPVAAAQGEAEAELVGPPPAVSDLELDLRVRHDSPEHLAGLTLEVALLAPSGKEKERYRIWLDTSGIQPGVPGVLRYRLEDVPYAAGDRLAVDLRRDVPARERSLYKEFPVAD